MHNLCTEYESNRKEVIHWGLWRSERAFTAMKRGECQPVAVIASFLEVIASLLI
ncbi:hypothetical protein LCD52_02695 [Rossellomorea vietnamensis]|uniref:hypothetical protein n=1 Tax=Rossellomorea vietnamensis TaxID=218284 RepID=UPI001CCAEDE2|nr:hypothetical protein [Rossellomorea vietnamensis]MCA0147690.1 hypothetical protein [Rossellomorea vietnamensis]